MRQLWMRAGITLNLSAEEADVILAPGASTGVIEQTVKKIILDGRFCFDGDSYIPRPCVEQYNDSYGTSYKADDIDFEVNISPVEANKESEVRRITGEIFCINDLASQAERHYVEVPYDRTAEHGHEEMLQRVARYCMAHSLVGTGKGVTHLNLSTIWKDHFKHQECSWAFCDEIKRLKRAAEAKD